MKLIKQQFPDLNIPFVELHLGEATTAAALEKTALKMNCPHITFVNEEVLKTVEMTGEEKFVVLTHGKSGGHWIAIFPVSKFSTSYYFFDSYGQDFVNNYYDISHYWPEHLRIIPLNNTDFQSDKTDICGWYDLSVIYCWYVLSNKQLKNVLKLIPIDKNSLFDQTTEFSRYYNDIMVTYFVDFVRNHTKEEIIEHFNVM